MTLTPSFLSHLFLSLIPLPSLSLSLFASLSLSPSSLRCQSILLWRMFQLKQVTSSHVQKVNTIFLTFVYIKVYLYHLTHVYSLLHSLTVGTPRILHRAKGKCSTACSSLHWMFNTHTHTQTHFPLHRALSQSPHTQTSECLSCNSCR